MKGHHAFLGGHRRSNLQLTEDGSRLAVREKVCAHARLLKRDCKSLPAITVVHSCFPLINLAGSWLISDRSCTQGAVYSYREIDRSTYFILLTKGYTQT